MEEHWKGRTGRLQDWICNVEVLEWGNFMIFLLWPHLQGEITSKRQGKGAINRLHIINSHYQSTKPKIFPNFLLFSGKLSNFMSPSLYTILYLTTLTISWSPLLFFYPSTVSPTHNLFGPQDLLCLYLIKLFSPIHIQKGFDIYISSQGLPPLGVHTNFFWVNVLMGLERFKTIPLFKPF